MDGKTDGWMGESLDVVYGAGVVYIGILIRDIILVILSGDLLISNDP